MKSGRKIYVTMLAAEDPAKAVAGLKNGSLRSLIVHLRSPNSEPPGEKRDVIEGFAMLEGCDRWVSQGTKGKGKVL